jgi:hypothetical protein
LHVQIPLVDGDRWWKYVARLTKWPPEVGDPQAVQTIQDELMKLFFKEKASGELEAQPPRPGASPPPKALGGL